MTSRSSRTPNVSGEVPWTPVSFPVAAGAHTFKWVYAKDGTESAGADAAWIDSVLLPVVRANTSTTISAHTPNPSLVGAPIAVTASVAVTPPGTGTPTGTITVSDGSVNCLITLPATSCNLVPTSPGAKTLTATYAGDANFNGSTSPGVAHTVNKASTTSTISAHTPNPSLVGAPIAVTASVAVTPPGTGTPTGTITVSDGTANCLITLPATSCNLVPTSPGAKTLTATYAGDANFNGSTSPGVAHTVNKASTTSTISAHTPNPSLVGAPIAVTASVAVTPPGTGTPTGTITVSDGTANCLITLPATSCNLVPTSAGAKLFDHAAGDQLQSRPSSFGAKTLTATYAGDANFNGSTSPGVAHTVNKANSSTALATSGTPSVFGQSVTFTATVTGTTPTGTVTFMDGATTLCNAVTLVSGQAPCLTSALSVASHSLTAVYSGDGINSGSTSAPLTQVVNKAATTSTISAHTPNPSLVGAPIAVTASVAVTPPGTGTPTGTITVSDGTANCLITLPATSCNLVPSSVGAKTLTATYAGAANFNGSTSPGVAHTVNSASTTSTISAHTPNPSLVGAPIAVTASVAVTPPGTGTPTGLIVVSDGGGAGCTITLPATSCNLVPTSPGAKTLTATYIGDLNFNGSTSPGVAHTVNNANSSTALATSGTPSVFGQSVTFTATVTGTTPTGTVTFMDGATTLCNAVTLVSGQAPCLTSALSVASHSLTAVYSGDGINSGSTSAPLTQVVNKAATTSTISAHTPNPSLVGAPIAVTASVAVTAPGTGTPTGTITVSDGSASCLITLPATSCNLVPTSPGAKTLTATYAGAANFNGSTSPGVAHTVNNANSSTALATSGTPSVFGQSVTFTATVTGTTPTGTVTFMDGATTLCNAVTLVSGQAPCLTSALSVASHSLTAVYSGDGINSGSTSAPLTQVVNKAATTSTISAHTPNPSLVGAPIAVTASVAVTAPGTGTPTGTITVSDGTASCLITLPATSCNLVPTSPGAKTLTATYAGDANFNGSTSPGVAHTVNNANSSTALATSGTPSVFGQSVTFTATVTGTTPTGTVTFMDGATTLCNAVTLVSGQAPCLTSALSVASHSLTAVYSGDGINSGSTSAPLTQVVNKAATTSTISAHTPNPSLVGAPIAVTASVAVTAPGTGTPTGTITVSDGTRQLSDHAAGDQLQSGPDQPWGEDADRDLRRRPPTSTAAPRPGSRTPSITPIRAPRSPPRAPPACSGRASPSPPP